MNKKFTIPAILFFITILSLGCLQQSAVNSITVKELKEKIKADSSIVILDVRTEQELSGPLGKIESSINIPVQDLSRRIDELDKYKNQNIYVICRSGNRSKIGTQILSAKGFNAINVLGGMLDYSKEVETKF